MHKTTALMNSTALLTCVLLGCSGKVSDPKPDAPPAPSHPETVPISQQDVMEAALSGKTETIGMALEQGYEVNSRDPENRTALMYAAFNGKTEIAMILIEAGADVNAQDTVGTSSLMFAASAPSGTGTVQLLLDNGAEINMTDNDEHFTALMWAAAEGQEENVKLLLQYKANISLKDVDGDTAESFAAKKGHTVIAKIIQDAASEETEAVQH
jgi:ankyrin repeat protein